LAKIATNSKSRQKNECRNADYYDDTERINNELMTLSQAYQATFNKEKQNFKSVKRDKA
jgi:hypothetical protein